MIDLLLQLAYILLVLAAISLFICTLPVWLIVLVVVLVLRWSSHLQTELVTLVITSIEERGAMTKKTGLFRRLESFEKFMMAANAEATVAVVYLTEKESSESLARPWKR
jgi:hypothetical protein